MIIIQWEYHIDKDYVHTYNLITIKWGSNETFFTTNCHTVQGQSRKYLRMTFTSGAVSAGYKNHTIKTQSSILLQRINAANKDKNFECPKKLPGFFKHDTNKTLSKKRQRFNRNSRRHQHRSRHRFLLFAKNSRLFGFEPIVSPLKRTRRSKQALTRALCSSNQSQYCQKGTVFITFYH